jgi:hypothetical protein
VRVYDGRRRYGVMANIVVPLVYRWRGVSATRCFMVSWEANITRFYRSSSNVT